MTYVKAPKPGEPCPIILLDRVVRDALPDYCTHGFAECVQCGHMCGLGHETEKLVAAGQASALCLVCADEVIPNDAVVSEHVQDHPRADGPH
ncbi:hypothetical protein [Aeromicrobium sp.]|uniref:hypothetical protein n=1 Tax=Aeromicrobium sp. TaxID=1871063 RepID=UPI0019B54F32|nr:hypothetical protein [Aeromicrobium sp.]MBC7630749.1 hypothetical protein [Aeromicrobium sp.]